MKRPTLTGFVLLVLLAILLLQIPPAYSEGNADQMVLKLGRGVANLATGWGELFTQWGKAMSETGGIEGFFVGFGKGVVWAFLREGAGAVETATFLFPFPNNYEPLMQPPTLFHGD